MSEKHRIEGEIRSAIVLQPWRLCRGLRRLQKAFVTVRKFTHDACYPDGLRLQMRLNLLEGVEGDGSQNALEHFVFQLGPANPEGLAFSEAGLPPALLRFLEGPAEEVLYPVGGDDDSQGVKVRKPPRIGCRKHEVARFFHLKKSSSTLILCRAPIGDGLEGAMKADK
jgi:hypothetical protein